jgi:hypothetical protein
MRWVWLMALARHRWRWLDAGMRLVRTTPQLRTSDGERR